MKKIISLTLCVIILLALSVPAFAAQEKDELHACYGSVVYVSREDPSPDGYLGNSEKLCFIYNEYYKIYADDYFEMQFNEFNSNYKKWLEREELYAGSNWYEMARSSDGTAKGKAHIRNIKDSDGLWFLTVIFNYEPEFSAETNLRLASSLSEGMDVVYVGNSTPCVVVAVRGGTDDIDKIIENENVALVETAFDPYSDFGVNDAIFIDTFAPTAADARKILRYAAKLEGLPEDRSEAKRFLFMSDTDLDGVITAADARTALRISAKLENGYTFSKGSSGSGAFWFY